MGAGHSDPIHIVNVTPCLLASELALGGRNSDFIRKVVKLWTRRSSRVELYLKHRFCALFSLT